MSFDPKKCDREPLATRERAELSAARVSSAGGGKRYVIRCSRCGFFHVSKFRQAVDPDEVRARMDLAAERYRAEESP